MTDRYYNPGQPGSFEGLPIAERYLKGKVKDFLIKQDTHTLHIPIRHRFRRRKYLLKGWTTRGHVFKVILGSSIEEQVWTLR